MNPIRFELWPQIKKIQRHPVEVAAAATAATLISLITMEVGINMEGFKSCKSNWPFSVNFWVRIKFYSSKWLWEKSSSGSVRISESFVMKLINVEGGFFLWRVEFFKIGKCDFTFIREMRVYVSFCWSVQYNRININIFGGFWIFEILYEIEKNGVKTIGYSEVSSW